ncbi:MAG: GyrI-like domain-containing protein [Rhodothermales bacterium]
MDVENFHKRLGELYLPPEKQFTLVDVPEIRFAVIDGTGNPESDESAEAVKWLYSVVHMVKPLVKERMGKNFVEPPPEFLFWADDEKDFIEGNKNNWHWRVMIVFVDWITQEQFEEAVAKVELKRGPAPESLRLENLHEGKSVQIMHVGDYGEISAVCKTLYNEYLPDNNLTPNGYYHEIYLNDPRRTAPEKRKLVIRQPVK